jgi:tetratricopeptide (TPR) repeat protein
MRCQVCHRRLAAGARCPQDGAAAAPVEPAGASTATPPSLAGFTVVSLLGRGGFGAVWEARPEDGSAPVAIKVAHATDPDTARRLGREAEALARVGPPHVPALRGQGVLSDGRAYLVMERLQGHTLAEELAGWPARPPPEAVHAIARALLASAGALAERRVLHRDLKPENVFLAEGWARLMDFGFALPVAASQEHQTLTEAGAGTPGYMSPEQIAHRDPDLRSDVYALGIMLYELHTMRLPFVGDARAVEYAHLSFRPPPPSRFAPVPAPIEAVILRCLAKDPAARFPDAGVLRAAYIRAGAAAPAAGQTAIAAAPAAVALGGDRQKVALLFLQGDSLSAVEIQEALQPFRGHLAHLAEGRCACAFTHQAGENPGQRALAAARTLLARGLAQRVILDVAALVVKPRPDGRPRFLGATLAEAERYPALSDPQGLTVAPGAGGLLPEETRRSADRSVRLPAPPEEGQARTILDDTALPLFGRERELAACLEDARRAAEAERPRVASVLGEAGLGKTHLAATLARRLADQVPGARVLELHARPPLGNDADQALAALLGQALELPAERPLDGGLSLLRDRLGEDSPEIVAAALALGWIAADHPAVQALEAAPGVLRANAARAGNQALRRLARQRPVMVILDDAQFADDALLDALEQPTVEPLPLWVCALARPEFDQHRPTWGQRAGHRLVLTLAPLDGPNAQALCRHLLLPAIGTPEVVLARLIERTRAVPRLLCDLVSGLKREGLLHRQAGGRWSVATEILDRVPESPLGDWLVSRELEAMPGELAAHARLLSLLAEEFSLEEAEGVLAALEGEAADAFPLDARVGIERLARSRLLIEPRPERWAFRTGVLREGVAQTLTGAVALAVHRAALAYYRGAALPEGIRLGRLAWHAARAGVRSEASANYLRLAEAARERHQYLEADLLYTRALEQMEEGDDSRLQAARGRGIMRYRLGRHDGSLADFAQARALAAERHDTTTEAEVLLDESMAHDWLFEYRTSRDLAERARTLVPAAPSLLEARILLALGRSLNRFNQDREAAPVLRQAMATGEVLGDSGYEVAVTAGLLLGFMLPFIGLPDEAEQRLARTIELCTSKGDELHLAAAWNNRSCLWIARNDRPRFMEDMERTRAYAHRMGNGFLERDAMFNAAYFLHWRGEFAAALPFVRGSITMEETHFREKGFRPESKVLMARILRGLGEVAEARALVEEVRAQQAGLRAQGAQSESLLLPNDEGLLEVITLMLFGGDAAAWSTVMERVRPVAQGQELIEALELAGVAAIGRGDRQQARRWFEEALDAGKRIPNIMDQRIRERLSALTSS